MSEPVYDVLIVGGGPAGLSAALMLGLARRHVALFDNGRPRGGSAPVSHGLFTCDAKPIGDILRTGRGQLRAYPTVEVLETTIVNGQVVGSLIEVGATDGRAWRARRAILAYGLVDELPPVTGLAECWGKTVFACPFCHGFEFRELPWAILAKGGQSLELVALARSWTQRLIVCTNGTAEMEIGQRDLLYRRNVPVIESPIREFRHEAGSLSGLVFADGSTSACRAVVFQPRQRPACDLPLHLGLIREGRFDINARTAQTANPNIYVAGDFGGLFAPQSLPSAVHAGSLVGRRVAESLAAEDFIRID